jgi:hypothetical protein
MNKLAAAVAVSLLLAGCEISDRPASAGRASSGPPAPVSVPAGQLTIPAASRVSSRWLADFDHLGKPYSPGAVAQLMTGEALQATLLNSDGPDVPTSQPNSPSFFVPVQAGYPRWFVQTEQFPGAISIYMTAVFVQAAPEQPWKAALLDVSPGSDDTRQLRDIARNSHGYATVIPVTDSGLAIAPAKLPAAWASLYNQGITAANDSRVIQPGQILYPRYVQNLALSNGPRNGFVESARQTPGNLPVYALALTGGGALVLFTTINTVDYRPTRTATITVNIDLSSGIPEPPWNFQRNFTVPAGTRLSQVTTFELVAIDPVRVKGHVEVIAANQVPTAFAPASEYAATHGQ